MVHCTGCSIFFKALSEGLCGKCVALTPIQRHLWPQCKTCGSTYQFLGSREECFQCEEAQESMYHYTFCSCQFKIYILHLLLDESATLPAVSDTTYAMTHPVNPRTHSLHKNVYTNPLTSQSGISGSLSAETSQVCV